MPYRNLSRIHPDYYLRAIWHDYTSRCFYLITFNKSDKAPNFSRISGYYENKQLFVSNNLNDVGSFIRNEILNLPNHFPHVEICNYCVMPDHVHIVLFVKEQTDIHLGKIVRKLKSSCSMAFKAAYPNSEIAINNLSLFHNGFNDKIVTKNGQLSAFKRYVRDNPRRFYIKANHGDFFMRSGKV